MSTQKSPRLPLASHGFSSVIFTRDNGHPLFGLLNKPLILWDYPRKSVFLIGQRRPTPAVYRLHVYVYLIVTCPNNRLLRKGKVRCLRAYSALRAVRKCGGKVIARRDPGRNLVAPSYIEDYRPVITLHRNPRSCVISEKNPSAMSFTAITITPRPEQPGVTEQGRPTRGPGNGPRHPLFPYSLEE